MSENPYATPQAEEPGFLPSEEVAGSPEDIRRKHINHEASIKSIGFLYYLSAVFCILAGVFMPVNDGAIGMNLLIGAALVALGILQFILGIGIRKLTQWGRAGGIILGAIGLVGFPIGTLISAYIIYLLVSRKGSMIFSPEYKEIIATTPHVKCKTSRGAWIALGVLLAIFAALAGLSFLTR